MEVAIKTDITWSHPKFGKVSLSNGEICLSEESIKVSGEMSREDSQKFTLAHPADVDIYADLEKNVTYCNATLDGAVVDLDLSKAHVTRYIESYNIEKRNFSKVWYLSSLRYSIRCSEQNNSYLLNIPFIHLFSHIGKLDEYLKSITLVEDAVVFEFSSIDKSHYTLMKTNASEEAVEKLLIHMAFFFNLPVEILMQTKEQADSFVQVTWNLPRFDTTKATLRHLQLAYMDIGACQNNFANFLKYSNWKNLDGNKKKNLKQAVYTFTRSKSCDDTMQFLTLYSILDRYVGNKKGIAYKGKSVYGLMEKKFEDYKIDIRRIGTITDPEINSMKLVLERENRDKEVTNFCDLRDYILHFMTTPEIDMFLASSELLSNMKFAVSAIILYEFGFKDYKFKQDWQHLSIFLE